MTRPRRDRDRSVRPARPDAADPLARHLVRRRRRETPSACSPRLRGDHDDRVHPRCRRRRGWSRRSPGSALVAYVALLVRLRRRAEERERKLRYLTPQDDRGWTRDATADAARWPSAADGTPTRPTRRSARPLTGASPSRIGCGMTSDPMTSEPTTHADGRCVARSSTGRELLTHPFYRRWEAGAAGPPASWPSTPSTTGRSRPRSRPCSPRSSSSCAPRATSRPPPWSSGTWPTSWAAQSPTSPCSTALPRPLPTAARATASGPGRRRAWWTPTSSWWPRGRPPPWPGWPPTRPRPRPSPRPRPTGCAAGTAMDPAGTEFWDVHAAMDADHGDWAIEALALTGGGSGRGRADAARRAADAWWALLDERRGRLGRPGSAELAFPPLRRTRPSRPGSRPGCG